MAEARKKTKLGILLLGGSFNPIHIQHIKLMINVKKYLEQKYGFTIIGGYLVISSDKYVKRKLKNEAISFKMRYDMCQLCCKDYKWLYPSHIEMASAGYYGQKITNINSYDHKFFKYDETVCGSLSKRDINNLYRIHIRGSDKCYINNTIMPLWKYINPKSKQKITILVGRQGYINDIKKAIDNDRDILPNNFIFMESDNELSDISSTKIRKYIHYMENELNNNDDSKNNNTSIDIINNNDIYNDFRIKCKNMLHNDIIEYIIKKLDTIWMINESQLNYNHM